MSEFIFVYGSLKRGESGHHLLQAAKAEFVCMCSVPGQVIEKEEYQRLVIDYKGTETALGELYLVRDGKLLDILDAYEVPYKRRQVYPVSMPTLSAWVWIL